MLNALELWDKQVTSFLGAVTSACFASVARYRPLQAFWVDVGAVCSCTALTVLPQKLSPTLLSLKASFLDGGDICCQMSFFP